MSKDERKLKKEQKAQAGIRKELKAKLEDVADETSKLKDEMTVINTTKAGSTSLIIAQG